MLTSAILSGGVPVPAPPSQPGYPSRPPSLNLDRMLSLLRARELMIIDDILAWLRAWGEVQLTVQDGNLRFIIQHPEL